MNEFDQRWKQLARTSGSPADDSLAEMPFGLAARIIARSREPVVETWDEVLSAVGLRALVVTACLCLISAGFAYAEWSSDDIDGPQLHQTFSDDLPWP